jgi:ubiquinone/menaquinone biosynthesis C-methylase UbiE
VQAGPVGCTWTVEFGARMADGRDRATHLVCWYVCFPFPHSDQDQSMSEIDRNKSNQERFRDGIGTMGARELETLLMNATNLAGTYYPEDRSQSGFALYAMSPEDRARPVAERMPPNSLRHYYGMKDGKYFDDLYLQAGVADTRTLRRILAEDGFDQMGERIMEFGCSAGRLIRHLEPEAALNEVWGIDLHSAAIHWAQAHLSPPFHFFTNTSAPHLPFEDNSFGLIFAGSVWTHIGELDDAWLLEMRRILRPGGRLYITISDEGTLAEIERINPKHPSIQHVAELDAATGMLSKDWVAFVTRTTPWLQRVVYRRQAWLDRIGHWMDVRIVRPNAYGWQTAVLLAKRG